MRVLCVFGRHAYGDPARGVSTEYRSFVPPLTRAGHEVVLFDSWDKNAYADHAELNRRLLETVERERPQVMLFVPFSCEVWLETLYAIKERGDVTTICWTTDDSWKYDQQSRYIGDAFHAITTTYPDVVAKYRRDGIDHVLLTQWAASPDDLREPVPAAECRYAVSFVGAAHGNRAKRVENLKAAGIGVSCFGHGWPAGPVSSEEMLEAIRRSIISLNFANSDGTNQIKARTFEVPGAGGFLLTEDAPGLERYYAIGEEIDVFHDDAELVEKIRHYLANPARRDAMVARAHERTRREHTYDVRMAELLAFAAERKGEFDARGMRRAIPLEKAYRAYRIGVLHRIGRALLLAVTTAIWGRRRGRRAARRLIYELSWRIFGARTFTAAGLPGRLFPKD